MILRCHGCQRDLEIGDVFELHDGLRLHCDRCPAVTVVRLEAGERTGRIADLREPDSGSAL